jgi:tellurite resistance protein
MGLFDKIFKVNDSRASELKLSSGEAFIAIIMSAVSADDDVTKDEIILLLQLLTRFKGLHQMTQNQFDHMFNRFQKIIKRDGVGTLVDSAKNFLNDDLRETAFANAVEIVLVDGVVDIREKEFLEHLQKAVNISDERAQMIVDVIMVKNRGTTSDIFSSNNIENMFGYQ